MRKHNIILQIFIMAMLVVLQLEIPVSADNATVKGKLGKHSKSVYEAVKHKLNIEDKDIAKAKVEGKTAFQLAGERGVKEGELRVYIINEAGQSLDRVMSKGLMPRFLVNRIKIKVKASIENWDGSF